MKRQEIQPAPGFGLKNTRFRDTCVCLDGDESYIKFPNDTLQLFFKQGLTVQVNPSIKF